MRPTVAKIDLAAIRSNIKTLKMKSRDLLLVAVKANAYGHGDIAVSLACEDAGADFLGVAMIEEGIHLRESAVDLPILVFGAMLPDEDYLQLSIYEISLAVYRTEQIRKLIELERPFRVHLKIDTGMGRVGIRPEELDDYLDLLAQHPNIILEGVMSHLAVADAPDGRTYTQQQVTIFNRCVDRIFQRGFRPIVHILNSAGTFLYDDLMSNIDGRRYMNRVGISAYGYSYVDIAPSELKKAMQISSSIVHIKTIAPGQCVSYGCEFTANRDTVVATIPMGYADGFKRSYQKGYVLVQGQKAPVIGRVCMDQFMIDVTDIPGTKLGDEVVILGRQGEKSIWADDLADWDDTINYEVLTSISERVRKINVNEITD